MTVQNGKRKGQAMAINLEEFKKQGPGAHGYPVHGYMRDGEPICHACVMDPTNPVHECPTDANARCSEADPQWCFIGADAYWEGPTLQCSHCGKELESAYGDPDADES